MRYGRTDLAHLKSGDNENMINDHDGWWGEVANSGDRLFVNIICTKYFEAD